jgi:[ribosomal protein S18]-alanine N-acetyltransferase
MPEPDVSIRIRRAIPADLSELVRLEQCCFAVPWSEDSLRHELTNNPSARVLVAEAPDGSLAGYAAFWLVLDEGQITNIAVDPAWRRQGIGSRLMQALISLAGNEGLNTLILEVRQRNSAAKGLYTASGFQSVGLRRGYYADNGEDAIIMLKKMK